MVSFARAYLICTVSNVLSLEGCSKKNLVLILCGKKLIVFLNKIMRIIFYFRLDFRNLQFDLDFLSPDSILGDSNFDINFIFFVFLVLVYKKKTDISKIKLQIYPYINCYR